MNRNTLLNIALFVGLSTVVIGGWYYIEKTYFPKPVVEQKPNREAMLAVTGGLPMKSAELADWPSRYVFVPPKPIQPVAPPKAIEPVAPAVAEPHRLIALSGTGFNNRVLLTSKGAGVQSTILPAFDHANRLGREAKNAEGRTYPLELIPGYLKIRNPDTLTDDGEHLLLSATESGKVVDPNLARQLTEPSYTLLHYPVVGDPLRLPDDAEKSAEKYPSAELSTRTWKVVSEIVGNDETPSLVVFETKLEAPYFLTLRKTFSLAKRDYHIRMKLEFLGIEGERPAEARNRAALRYQIVGAHGLPLEGEWYTGVHRNAFTGWRTPNGYGKRDIQDSRTINVEAGGNRMEPQGNTFTYAGVVTQFFTSALCPSPEVGEEDRKNYWAAVRASREASPGVQEDKPQLADITVRVVSNPIDPAPGQKIEHQYWIYNGPTKVRLLKHLNLLEASKLDYQTDAATVDRYLNDLTLYTLTDAPTPNWFGKLADSLYWTPIVIWFTNLMHDVLGWLHQLVGIWGVNIIMLTVLVRLLLMIPSRRQQASMMKLQDKMALLKPELDKLAEKYKDDPQRLNQEKTKLMIQSGVNPLSSMGGCLLMFAQMPIFMGLYYCLQESIFFRLDSFLWIKNLAAPDMLLWWTEAIPYASSARDMGGTVYIGPFLNILPIVAVTLMFINMKLSSPPPADEQQAMQQKMMKYMMLFMAFMFYKMAAGMCVYFIISTSWGIIERRLLKKKAQQQAEDAKNNPPDLASLGEPSSGVGKTKNPLPPAPLGRIGQFKADLMEKFEKMQREAETQRQIVNNPQQKSAQPGSASSAQSPTNRKKKRKKK